MQDYGFIRVSSGSQDAPSQERDIKRVSPNAIIVTPDTKAASASAGEQMDALDELIAKLTPGDRIIVTDSSRLDRRENPYDQLRALLAIYDAGTVIVSLMPGEEDFAKSDFRAWKNTIDRQSANAEKSVVVKSMTWRGVQSIIENRASYGPLPVFWEAKGKKFAKVATCVNPDAVNDVYESVRSGKSLSSIARKYDTYPQSIRKLIRLAANYTGIFECRYTYGGQTYTWQHAAAGTPPIDRELWHDANRVMGKRGAVMNNTGGRPVRLAKSWISGILDCPGCGGHLYVLRGKTLRCGGKGKYRRNCGLAGIDLGYVIGQIDELIYSGENPVYRYQRVHGNQGELDELKAELERVQQTLATTDDDDISDLVARRKTLREAISSFDLVAETYAMTPTGETLGEVWHLADSKSRREMLKALHGHLDFSVNVEGDFSAGELLLRGSTLVELTSDLCVKMAMPPRDIADPWTA